MVGGWKYFLGSRVDITTCALGKVEEAISITPLSTVATLSCCALRSFVPVCIIMWLGDPSWSSDRRSRARWVNLIGLQTEGLGHAGCLDTRVYFIFLYIFPI